MVILLVVLLAVWLIVIVIGFTVKALLWLAFIGIILFVATIVIGIVRRRISRSRGGGA